jgi:hypothetical protein
MKDKMESSMYISSMKIMIYCAECPAGLMLKVLFVSNFCQADFSMELNFIIEVNSFIFPSSELDRKQGCVLALNKPLISHE